MPSQRTLALFLFGPLAACGNSSSSISPDASIDAGGEPLERLLHSGTRIEAKFFQHTASQVSLYRHAWDKQLEISCSVRLAEDQSLRCLPSAGSDLAYLDDQCTQPVYLARTTEDQEQFSYGQVSPLTCTSNATRQIYQVQRGQNVDISAGLYLQGTAGCQATNVPAEAEGFAVTAMPATDFVEFESEDTDYAEGLIWRRYRGSDGALLPQGFWDQERMQPCMATSSHQRCVPGPEHIGFIHPSRFVDSACTTTGILSATMSCQPQVVWQSERIDACNSTTNYLQVGAVATAYKQEGQSCVEDATTTLFSPGAAIDPTTLPTLVSAKVPGVPDAPLQLERYEDAIGSALRGNRFWHKQWQDRCSPELVGNEYRCIPERGPKRFSDPRMGPSGYDNANCEGQLLAEIRPCADDSVQSPIYDPATHELFDRGAPYTGDVWSKLSDGECLAVATESTWLRVGALSSDEALLIEEATL